MSDTPDSPDNGNELWAWQAQETDGRWSLIGLSVDGGDAYVPIIHRSPEFIESVRPLALRHVQTGNGEALRLVKLTAEVVETVDVV